jgi:MFS family permease
MLVHITLTGGRISVMLAGLHLGMSTFDVGLLIAFFALIPMFAAISMGRLIDRIGAFKPMRLAGILTITGIALPFIWLHWIGLGIAAVFIGLGHMAFQLGTQQQLGQAEPEQRLKNFSWLALSLAISGFSGPLLAGLAIDNLGYRWAFALLALPPMLALIGLIQKRAVITSGHQPKETPAVRQKATDLLKIRDLRYTFAANGLLASAWDTHMFLVPLYGVSRDLSATTIGVILAAFALATFLIRTLLPLIQRWASPWQLIHFAMITTGLNFVLYPLFSEIWVLMLLSFVLGLSLGCTQPSILALLQQHAPPGRKAEAFGLRMSLVNGSQVSLPIAFGALGAFIGVMPLFWAAAVAIGSGAWLTRRADPQRAAGKATKAPKPPKPPKQDA